MVLASIDDPRWRRLVETYQRREDLGPPELVGSVRWNRVFDSWVEAYQRVVSDGGLLDAARALVSRTSDPLELQFLHEVLEPPFVDRAYDIKGLLKDPRVGLSPEKVRWSYAIYLTEQTRWGRDDPYETDVLGSELVRSLSRIGGAPTRISGMYIPTDPFLLQVDLGQQLRDWLHTSAAKTFVRRSPLPRGGLLQLFHSTTGDSYTDAAVSGGGATVLYFSEQQLRARQGAALGHESAVFPVHGAKSQVLPSFTFPDAGAADDVVMKVIALQDGIDRFARGDEVSDEVSLQEAKDPFVRLRQPPVRLLGVQHYDYPLEPYDTEMLMERLPLEEEGDEHLLLFTVPSQFSFETVYGDGVLEVWIRRSDVLIQRFDRIFSRIASS